MNQGNRNRLSGTAARIMHVATSVAEARMQAMAAAAEAASRAFSELRESEVLHEWRDRAGASLRQRGEAFSRIVDVVGRNPSAGTQSPHAGFSEGDTCYWITVELPDAVAATLAVTIAGHAVEVVAERTGGKPSYSAVLELPKDADSEDVSGQLDDGILRIRVAKKPTARARPVPINGQK